MPLRVNVEKLINDYGGPNIWAFMPPGALECRICPNSVFKIKFKSRIVKHAHGLKHNRRLEDGGFPATIIKKSSLIYENLKFDDEDEENISNEERKYYEDLKEDIPEEETETIDRLKLVKQEQNAPKFKVEPPDDHHRGWEDSRHEEDDFSWNEDYPEDRGWESRDLFNLGGGQPLPPEGTGKKVKTDYEEQGWYFGKKGGRKINIEKLIGENGGKEIWALSPDQRRIKCRICPDSIFEVRFKSRVIRHVRSGKHVTNLEQGNFPTSLLSSEFNESDIANMEADEKKEEETGLKSCHFGLKRGRKIDIDKLVDENGGHRVWAISEDQTIIECRVCPDSRFEVRFKSRIVRHVIGRIHIENLEEKGLPTDVVSTKFKEVDIANMEADETKADLYEKREKGWHFGKIPGRKVNLKKLIGDHGGTVVWDYLPDQSALKCRLCQESSPFPIRFRSRIVRHVQTSKHIAFLKENGLPLVDPEGNFDEEEFETLEYDQDDDDGNDTTANEENQPENLKVEVPLEKVMKEDKEKELAKQNMPPPAGKNVPLIPRKIEEFQGAKHGRTINLERLIEEHGGRSVWKFLPDKAIYGSIQCVPCTNMNGIYNNAIQRPAIFDVRIRCRINKHCQSQKHNTALIKHGFPAFVPKESDIKDNPDQVEEEDYIDDDHIDDDPFDVPPPVQEMSTPNIKKESLDGEQIEWNFVNELVFAFMSANISLAKLQNPTLRKFFKDFTGHSLPHFNDLRRVEEKLRGEAEIKLEESYGNDFVNDFTNDDDMMYLPQEITPEIITAPPPPPKKKKKKILLKKKKVLNNPEKKEFKFKAPRAPLDMEKYCLPQEYLKKDELGRQSASCALCSFDSKGSLALFQKHVNEHKRFFADVESPINCPECNESQATKWHLLPHLMKVHEKQDLHCFLCMDGQTFKGSQSYNKHLMLHLRDEIARKDVDDIKKYLMPIEFCKKIGRLTCSLCYQTMRSKIKFLAHIQDHETQFKYLNINEEVRCHVCPAKLPSKWDIVPHHIREHGLKEYLCFECHKQKERLIQITTHMGNYHTEKGVFQRLEKQARDEKTSCPKCGKSLTTASLPQHMEIQHPSGTEERIICDICGFECFHPNKMKKHMDRVHPKKIYVCKIDQQEFFCQWEFEKHYRIHQSAKPYKCVFCEYRSVKGTGCLAHLRTVHRNIIKGDAQNYRIKDQEWEKLPPLHEICDIRKFDGWKVRNMKKQNAKDEKLYNCTICAFTSSSQMHLARHVETKHSGHIDSGRQTPYDFILRPF